MEGKQPSQSHSAKKWQMVTCNNDDDGGGGGGGGVYNLIKITIIREQQLIFIVS